MATSAIGAQRAVAIVGEIVVTPLPVSNKKRPFTLPTLTDKFNCLSPCGSNFSTVWAEAPSILARAAT